MVDDTEAEVEMDWDRDSVGVSVRTCVGVTASVAV